MFRFPHKYSVGETMRGFTLVELMVTISIFMVISSVVLYENSKFNSSILLTNSAYEVALTVRQAQVYGVASRKVTIGGFAGGATTVGGKTAYQIGYGLYFDDSTADKSKRFILFADVNSNSQYDAGEEITTSTFNRDIKVSDLCFQYSGSWHCNGASDSAATIIFKRPNPEPAVFKNNTNSPGISYIKIRLKSDTNASAVRCVIVNSIGQTSVKAQNNC
jgi:prepilin-type N-terminal cleavage/methylation domain-containing protein